MPFAGILLDHLERDHSVHLIDAAQKVMAGDIAFYLSCEKLVPVQILKRNQSNIVVHASNLPEGKGMSPLTWQILEGKNEIPITLFEAVEALDAGPVYLRNTIRFAGHELLPEMQKKLGKRIVEMCEVFVDEFPAILNRSVPQAGSGSRYRKRTPMDSKLDPTRSIAEQFDLLRVVDNERYPAFFEMRGHRYLLKIETADE